MSNTFNIESMSNQIAEMNLADNPAAAATDSMVGLSSKAPRRKSRGRPLTSDAGRVCRLCVCLPPELVDKFRALGGSTWLRKIVQKADVERDGL